MAFIGNTNTTQAFTPAIDYFSGNGSTTAFTLSRPVASVAQVQVTIDNVAQNPSSAYTVSANTITFTSAPLSGTNNIYVYYTSPITQVIAPGQGTVVSSSFGTITDFTTTGNTILGDATTDTLTVGVTGIVKDSNGNVGIGTTSIATIDVTGKTLEIYGGAGGGFVHMTNSTTGQTVSDGFIIGTSIGGSDALLVQRESANMIFRTADTERMRIDSSGNVLIATTNAITGITGAQLTASNTSENPAYINIFRDDTTIGNGQYLGYLQFCGRDATSSLGTGHAYVAAVAQADHGAGDNATAITFGTTPDNSSSMVERMRIDSSGNVMVGSTSLVNDSILSATQSANTGCFGVLASNASFTATVICGSTSRASSSNFDFLGMYTNGLSTAQFRVGGNGVIYAQNTSVQSISDQRLKENIRDSSDGLAVVNALRPVRYDWKKGYGNDQKNQLGFIAQEIETVFPESVSEWQINKDEETTYKTVGPSALIPVLVKAIQELKAINDTQAETINALTARIVALENR